MTTTEPWTGFECVVCGKELKSGRICKRCWQMEEEDLKEDDERENKNQL